MPLLGQLSNQTETFRGLLSDALFPGVASSGGPPGSAGAFCVWAARPLSPAFRASRSFTFIAAERAIQMTNVAHRLNWWRQGARNVAWL